MKGYKDKDGEVTGRRGRRMERIQREGFRGYKEKDVVIQGKRWKGYRGTNAGIQEEGWGDTGRRIERIQGKE